MDPSAMEAAAEIDMGVIRGVIAALTMVVYLGIFRWAYHSDNRERFETDALLPFADEAELSSHAEEEGGRR